MLFNNLNHFISQMRVFCERFKILIDCFETLKVPVTNSMWIYSSIQRPQCFPSHMQKIKFNNFFAFILFQSNQRMVEFGLIWWQWNYETKVNEENIEQLFRQFRRTFTKLQYSLRKMWKGWKWLIDVKLCKWAISWRTFPLTYQRYL